MPRYRIISIDQYNLDATRRESEALSRWRDGGSGHGYPVRSMFFFMNRYGDVRRKGFVLCYGDSYRWFARKKDALDCLDKLQKEW